MYVSINFNLRSFVDYPYVWAYVAAQSLLDGGKLE